MCVCVYTQFLSGTRTLLRWRAKRRPHAVGSKRCARHTARPKDSVHGDDVGEALAVIHSTSPSGRWPRRGGSGVEHRIVGVDDVVVVQGHRIDVVHAALERRDQLSVPVAHAFLYVACTTLLPLLLPGRRAPTPGSARGCAPASWRTPTLSVPPLLVQAGEQHCRVVVADRARDRRRGVEVGAVPAQPDSTVPQQRDRFGVSGHPSLST